MLRRTGSWRINVVVQALKHMYFNTLRWIHYVVGLGEVGGGGGGFWRL
jgi:hypothetical protein